MIRLLKLFEIETFAIFNYKISSRSISLVYKKNALGHQNMVYASAKNPALSFYCIVPNTINFSLTRFFADCLIVYYAFCPVECHTYITQPHPGFFFLILIA
jgi:hypothetical protein